MVSPSTAMPSPIKAEALETLPGIQHGFFTREGGVSINDLTSLNCGLGAEGDRENALVNRKRCLVSLSLDESTQLQTPYQVHSPDVVRVESLWEPGEGPKSDAVVTVRPDIAVGIVTADCGPILFADADNGVVGAAHAGWRGAVDGVLENTIDAMISLGAERSKINAVLGPTISQDNYEVGPEFIAKFLAASAENSKFFKPSIKEGHALFNLPDFIIEKLDNAGIKSATNLDLCTYENENLFFSYRRSQHRGEADYGRLISIIALSEKE